MKLLMLTQVLDERDDVLGFVHGWVSELAKHVDELHVVALRVGKHHLPANVRVTSLGKEHGRSIVKYLGTLLRVAIGGVKSYDRVFVHMNPEYLVLFGWWWRMMGKKSALWYTHKHVDLKLRIAAFFVDRILTASPESFRLASPKLHVMGHGIDTEFIEHGTKTKVVDGVFRILSICRIAPAKNLHVIVEATEILVKAGRKVEVIMVGGPATDADVLYRDDLLRAIGHADLGGHVHLVGSVAHQDILPYLHGADCFVNTSKTGSLDKAVLEAMAGNVPVVTTNEGLRSALGEYAETLMCKDDKVHLAKCLGRIMDMPPGERARIGDSLHGIVQKNHSLTQLMPRIMELLR